MKNNDTNIWLFLSLFVLLIFGGCGTMKFLSKKQVCQIFYPEMTNVLCWFSDLSKPAARERE